MIGRDGYGSFLRFYSLFGENEKVKIKKNKKKNFGYSGCSLYRLLSVESKNGICVLKLERA